MTRNSILKRSLILMALCVSLSVSRAYADTVCPFSGEIDFKAKTFKLNKPFKELSGSFEMKDSILYLDSLALDGVTLSGQVELFYPYKIDFAMKLKEMKMADFLS